MSEIPAEWIEVVEGLQGTYMNDPPEHLRDDPAFCDYLDNEIFRCSVCEWWCELSEMESEGVCSDCDEDDA